MTSLSDALKYEITRLARKEIRGEIASLRTASARYRSDIADLKKVVKDQEKRLAYLERRERPRVERLPSPKAAEGARFSAKGLRSHREKLGLSAADYGRLAGVSAQTIYSYEQGRSKPRPAQLAKLVELRSLGKRQAQQRLALLEA